MSELMQMRMYMTELEYQSNRRNEQKLKTLKEIKEFEEYLKELKKKIKQKKRSFLYKLFIYNFQLDRWVGSK